MSEVISALMVENNVLKKLFFRQTFLEGNAFRDTEYATSYNLLADLTIVQFEVLSIQVSTVNAYKSYNYLYEDDIKGLQ